MAYYGDEHRTARVHIERYDCRETTREATHVIDEEDCVVVIINTRASEIRALLQKWMAAARYALSVLYDK